MRRPPAASEGGSRGHTQDAETPRPDLDANCETPHRRTDSDRDLPQFVPGLRGTCRSSNAGPVVRVVLGDAPATFGTAVSVRVSPSRDDRYVWPLSPWAECVRKRCEPWAVRSSAPNRDPRAQVPRTTARRGASCRRDASDSRGACGARRGGRRGGSTSSAAARRAWVQSGLAARRRTRGWGER
jgi:hypothetical protein